jgi:ribonuclease Y
LTKEILIIISAILLSVVMVLTVVLFYMRFSKSRKNLLQKVNDDARRIKMETLADTRAEIAKIKYDANREIEEQINELVIGKNELTRKKELFHKDLELIIAREQEVTEVEKVNLKLKRNLQKSISDYNEKLAEVTHVNLEEARTTLFQNMKIELNAELDRYIEGLKDRTKKRSQEVASKIIVSAMQKYATQIVTTSTIARIPIPDDEMKGKIIGKEGRNIRAFEQYGGVDIIIDGAQNSISVSSFNPIRREIAIRALKSLMEDGRIQPVRIEEALIEEERKIDEIIEEAGDETIRELDVYDLNDDIKIMLGRLKFRTSYNQNVLQHSIEVAKISAAIAAELELDEGIALRCGLLHDIGKAVDYEQEGSHVVLGVKILKRANMNPIIINAVEAHHDDAKKETLYAEIVAIADAISAARPGARNNSVEDFFIRMDDIEQHLRNIDGVKKAFVLQSGRQIRVMVDPVAVNELEFVEVSRKVHEVLKAVAKIPGEIVITVIRESRLVSKLNNNE